MGVLVSPRNLMPRLPPSLFWRARRYSPCAALLLPVCRDLPSALTELRWIREYVDERKDKAEWRRYDVQQKVLSMCRRRGRGEPLQYVLGTQPFGSLDLLCRRGVLIPRPEPEAYSLHLADMLLRERVEQMPKNTEATPLTILDACTGTGCIALLLYAELYKKAKAAGIGPLQVVGADLAQKAVSLSRTNAIRNGLVSRDVASKEASTSSSSVRFVQGDLFSDDWLNESAVQGLLQQADPSQPPRIDVLVSNPPYISTDGFAHDTARSVRLFEPKLAQVPDQVPSFVQKGGLYAEAAAEDVFYVRLLELAARLDARILLCEVGGLEQAERVVTLALKQSSLPLEVEIWADHPDIVDVDDPERSVTVAGRKISIKGGGHGRSVFIRRR